MKRLLGLLLLAASSIASAANCDLVIRQLDAWGNEVPRLVAVPSGCSGASGVIVYDLTTMQPQVYTLASSLAFSSGMLGVSSSLLTGYVTTSSLSSTLANYSTTAATAAGLATKFNNPTGTITDYVRGDGSIWPFPSIPAAQVNADWNASSGVAQILNKPTIPSAPVNADWNSSSGLSQILNKPSIPAAQVNADWNAASGVAQILNKPTVQAIQRLRAQTNTSGLYTWTFPAAYGAGVTPVVQVSVEDTTGGGAAWQHVITAISNTSVTVQLTKTTAVTVLGISVLGIGSTPQAYVHMTAVAP